MVWKMVGRGRAFVEEVLGLNSHVMGNQSRTAVLLSQYNFNNTTLLAVDCRLRLELLEHRKKIQQLNCIHCIQTGSEPSRSK